MKVAWDSAFSFLVFSLETTVEKFTWMRTIPVTLMVITSKVPFWKLLDISYVQSSFSTNTKHSDNGIWKRPCSWRFDGSHVLILSWVNIIKRQCTKMLWKLLIAQKSETVLWRTLYQDISLIIMFFFSQTYLVFEFSLVLIK